MFFWFLIVYIVSVVANFPLYTYFIHTKSMDELTRPKEHISTLLVIAFCPIVNTGIAVYTFFKSIVTFVSFFNE